MIKKAASFLTAVLIFFMAANIPVSIADGGPDLTIETIEIDQNDIPQDGFVQVRVSIGNNPGINGVAFNIQADRRLRIDNMKFAGREINEVVTWGGCLYNESENIASAHSIFDPDSWYYGNGVFMTLKFYLPEDRHAGDFYPINFIEGYEYEEPRYSAEDGMHYKNESFGTLVSGGIRITGSDPVPEVPVQQPDPPVVNVPEPDEPSQPAQQPERPEQPQDPAPAETQPEETTIVSETVAEVTTTTVSVTTAVSSETVIQTTDETTVTVTVSETETAADTSVSDTDDDIKEENKNSIPVWIIVLIVAAVILIPAALSIKRSNSNE